MAKAPGANGESFVERRIRQGQRAGAFDGLALEGKPIPDLGEERPAGWWADSFLQRDQARQRLVELSAEAAARKSRAWQLDDHEALRAELVAINRDLTAANAEADPTDRRDLLDVEAELATWRAQRRRRRFGRYLAR